MDGDVGVGGPDSRSHAAELRSGFSQDRAASGRDRKRAEQLPAISQRSGRFFGRSRTGRESANGDLDRYGDA